MTKKNENTRILNRIEKCLKLAASANPAESAAALRHAQKLMEKHGVDKGTLEFSRVSQETRVRGTSAKPPLWVLSLCRLIAKAFAVRYIDLVRKRPPLYVGGRYTYQSEVIFVGLDDAPAVAMYAFDMLFRKLKGERKRFVAELDTCTDKAEKTRLGDLYSLSWLAAVEQQVVALAQNKQESTLLTNWIKNEYSNAEKMNTPKLQEVDFNDRRAIEAISAGYESGKDVSLHRPISGAQPHRQLG